jgi:uncharacterized membrane protein (UPF0136 family)
LTSPSAGSLASVGFTFSSASLVATIVRAAGASSATLAATIVVVVVASVARLVRTCIAVAVVTTVLVFVVTVYWAFGAAFHACSVLFVFWCHILAVFLAHGCTFFGFGWCKCVADGQDEKQQNQLHLLLCPSSTLEETLRTFPKTVCKNTQEK